MNKKNSIHQFMVFFKAALLLSVTLAFMACPNAVLEPPERETPSYTVSFNANGGSGNMNSITVQEGTIITLNDCPFNKSGMMFVAWNTNGDGHGTGYPNGLTSDDLPDQSRLLTIIDVYDALTAEDRPYKPPMPPEKAFGILKSMRDDGQIDGRLLDEFIESKAWEKDK